MSVKKIAKLAGVSVATVSRVLNNSSTVKRDTYEKVTAIIKEIGYHPNILARQLRTTKTSLILVIFSDITNPFISATLKSIEYAATQEGYQILYGSTDGTTEMVEEILNVVSGKSIEGVITMDEISLHPTTATLSHTIPWVLCGETSALQQLSSVCINDEEASYFATKILIESGRKNIALINHNQKYTYAQKRQQGYERALHEYSLHPHSITYVNDISFKSGENAARKLYSTPSKPDAIIAISDMLAIGAMYYAKQKGIDIPRKLSVIGFDDIPVAEMITPPLSTIRQSAEDMGKTAINILVNKIESHEKTNCNVTLRWQFIERGTH
ncbi:TPA: LacI family DNA-binding transcriptional regulator [Klebsiella pneumoniae]